MGMFDWVRIGAAFGERFRCSAGHKLADLQTKDFDCEGQQLLMTPDGFERPHRHYVGGWAEMERFEGDRQVDVLGECRECGTFPEWRVQVKRGAIVSIEFLGSRL